MVGDLVGHEPIPELRIIPVDVESEVRQMGVVPVPLGDRVASPFAPTLGLKAQHQAGHRDGNPVHGKVTDQRVDHFGGSSPGEKRCRPPEDLVLLLKQPVAFLQLPQLGGVGLLQSRPDPVLDLSPFQPVKQGPLADPEILRDLTQGRFMFPRDRDSVATELFGVMLGHDDHPSRRTKSSQIRWKPNS